MIKNEKQYRITKNKLKKFEESLKIIADTQKKEDLFIVEIQLESIKSQIAVFKDEIEEFERLKAGEIKCFKTSIVDLSEGIINSRIARGLNHKKFAKLLGISEQQVQKYESENYQSTSLNRLGEILDILDVNAEAIFNLTNNPASACINKDDFLRPDDINPDVVNDLYRKRKTTVKICA